MAEVVGGVKKYGVSIVGRKYPFVYESTDEDAVDGTKEIQLRTVRSLSFEEHLDHVRKRALISNRHGAIARKMRVGFEAIRALKPGDQPEGMNINDFTVQRLDELAGEIERDQLEIWEMTKEQIIRLVNPAQHEEWCPILEKADPAQINEMLTDMEAEVIERHTEETQVAAGVDPTSPPPQSGSSDTPTSGPDSGSTELTSIDFQSPTPPSS